MGKHTQEPWKLYHDESSGEWPMIMAGDVVAGKIVANVNPSSFCIPANGFVEMPSLDNARRIVACVNACAGIPTEDLKESPDMGLFHLAEFSEHLLQQRDELLAALELMVAIHDEPSGFSGKYGKALDDAIQAQEEKIDKRLLMARAAIAKAKGGAA